MGFYSHGLIFSKPQCQEILYIPAYTQCMADIDWSLCFGKTLYETTHPVSSERRGRSGHVMAPSPVYPDNPYRYLCS